MENTKIENFKKLATAGMFLALTFFAIIIQIPIPATFLKLDFSVAIILLSLKYTKVVYTFFIAIIAPFILFFVGGEIIGITFLVFLNVIVIIFQLFFENFFLKKIKSKKLIFFMYFLLFFCLTIILSFANIFIFTPAYYNFDYQIIFDNFAKLFFITIFFNLFKLVLNYFFYFFLLNNFYNLK
ncbi:MAG: hypothetical protein HPPSJP_0730 [Candidatus Hepatoplasma scabrum]|nr:MAG: hypothetical protein HPPSJP_0730 [Candidatus Hepatoplasma sp.]